MTSEPQTPDPKSTQTTQPGPDAPKTALGRFRHSALTRYLWKEWVKPVGAAVLVVMTFKSAVADWYDVPTGSMEPSIIPGDRIGVNKLAYDLKVPFTLWRLAEWGGPARGDVVILLSPKEDRTRLVKRVIGMPGDTVALHDNRLYVNGEAVNYEVNASFQPLEGFQVLTEELPGHEHPVMTHLTTRSKLSTFGPTTVPDDHYMVMGDNRDLSADSRVFGFVPRHLVLGRAGRVILSLDRKNWWAPRWERFFEKLP